MTYTFDYIVAPLKCVKCGLVSKEDQWTNMQTKICKHPTLSCLGLGTKLDLIENIEDAGYLCLNKPIKHDCFTFLDFWSCAHCDEINSSIINILESIIFSIIGMPLGKYEISNINYVSYDYQNYIGWNVEGNIVIYSTEDV